MLSVTCDRLVEILLKVALNTLTLTPLSSVYNHYHAENTNSHTCLTVESDLKGKPSGASVRVIFIIIIPFHIYIDSIYLLYTFSAKLNWHVSCFYIHIYFINKFMWFFKLCSLSFEMLK